MSVRPYGFAIEEEGSAEADPSSIFKPNHFQDIQISLDKSKLIMLQYN